MERVVLGIKIWRRPKSRASIENAPGPKKKIAVAVVSTYKIVSLLSSRLGVGEGSQEIAYPMVHNTTMKLVMGVRIPARKHSPPKTASTTAATVSNLKLLRWVK